MEHPAEETLRRFRRGEGSPEENREVVAHLLRGCKICSEIVKEAMQPESPSVRGRAAVRSGPQEVPCDPRSKAKYEALRAAQLDLIRRPLQVQDGRGGWTQRNAAVPYFWAALQLVGDGR